MILASHLQYAILLLKTFTEYLVVWVFSGRSQKARSLRCQAYWLLTSSGKLARDCEHIGQKHRNFLLPLASTKTSFLRM